MRKFIFFFAFTFILASCAEKKDEVIYATHIVGLASPIQLKYDSTWIYITDYFPDVKGFSKAVLEGKTYLADADGRLCITSGIMQAVGNMEAYYHDVRHDIPVFKSDKEKYTFTYKATSEKVQKVELAGSMNGWNRKATPLTFKDGQWTADIVLTKGLYQYRVWEDDRELMDANNTNTISNGMGGLNNTFQVGNASTTLPHISTTIKDEQNVSITADEVNVMGLVYFENKLIDNFDFKETGTSQSFEIPAEAKQLKRSHIRIYGYDTAMRSNDVLIPLASGKVITNAKDLERTDLQASIMYFMMVDRFVDGDTSNNRPTVNDSIASQANNLGGDLAGITQKIKDGYFKNLGVNTLWISPISTNAEGAWGYWKDKSCKEKETTNCVSSKFSAYHGYWPTSLRTIDNRFGNDAQLKELISTAHANGMNVILDYVAHHVHQDHPLYKQKPDWTTPLYLPDGRMNTELWDEQRLTTWFDTFLPTWNFANDSVVHALTDTAMYWVENYDLDGFRHDATKHIREEFWRELTQKVKAYKRAHPERMLYQVGETYGSAELISSYIGSGQLDAQFDFNLYDAAVDAFAKNETNFENLERVLNESLRYYGHHHVMGNITGNQDRARFISYADGSVQFSEDAKHAGWTRTIENKDTIGYQKLELLSAFLLTTPGIPCIYYGDEIGMPGGNDPDNRRMMHFGDWNASQTQLHIELSMLTELRRNNMALMYGDFSTLYRDETTWVYARKYFDDLALVVLNKSNAAKTISFDVPFSIDHNQLKAVYGSHFTYGTGTLTMQVDAMSWEVLKN